MPISTPTPTRSPAIGGESAFTYCMVCGSSFSQCDGYDVGISQRAGASAGPQAARARRPAPAHRPAPACGPHCSSSICFTGTVLTTCLPRVCFIATAVRRSHSSCYYYFFLCPRHLRYRGRGKNWLENVNAGMTISPGGLPPQNCCGAR